MKIVAIVKNVTLKRDVCQMMLVMRCELWRNSLPNLSLQTDMMNMVNMSSITSTDIAFLND